MNRIEFYNKLDKAKAKRDEELYHSEYGDYYNKLENYYGIGKARYFKTKAEWDAYQEGLSREKAKQKQLAEKAANKEAERGNDMSGFNEWKKQQDLKKQREDTYNKNKAADDERIRKIEESEAAKKSMKNKLNEINDPIAKQRNDNLNKNMYAAEAEVERERQKREAEKAENEKQVELYKQRKENIRKAKEAEEAKKEEERKKHLHETQKRLKEEREANTKKILDDFKEKERQRINDSFKSRDAEIQDNIKREQSKIREREEQREELEKWKTTSREDLGNSMNKIRDAVEACYKDRNRSFNVNNEYTKMLKEILTKADPDFDGDISKYVRPSYEAAEWLKNHDMDPFRDDEHMKNVDDAITQLENSIRDSINNTSYENMKYDTFIDKAKASKDAKTNVKINAELAKARLSLRRMAEGDNDKFDIDPDLEKVVRKKLAEKDEDFDERYDSIYKYVRPHLFGKFFEDTESYNTVKDILNEIEKELKDEAKNPTYTDFMNKVDKYF